MKIGLASVALVAVVSAAAVSAAAAPAALKCMPQRVVSPVVTAPDLGGEPARPLSESADYLPVPTVYVLDARVVDEAAVKAVDPETISSIQVVCSDERHQVFGIEPGMNVIVVFTKPGPHADLEKEIVEVAQLQATHLARHGAFARTLEELRWKDPSGLIAVDLAVSDDGGSWTARGTHRYLIGRTPIVVTATGTK
jgi:hypothetical protein